VGELTLSGALCSNAIAFTAGLTPAHWLSSDCGSSDADCALISTAFFRLFA